MSDEQFLIAIGRLEDALSRGERAADKAEQLILTSENQGDGSDLAARLATLKAEAALAVQAMDRILGDNNG